MIALPIFFLPNYGKFFPQSPNRLLKMKPNISKLKKTIQIKKFNWVWFFFISQILTKQVQTIAIIHEALTELVFFLQVWDYIIFKVPHHFLTNFWPELYLFSPKAYLDLRFHRYQCETKTFHSLRIVRIPEKNLRLQMCRVAIVRN